MAGTEESMRFSKAMAFFQADLFYESYEISYGSHSKKCDVFEKKILNNTKKDRKKNIILTLGACQLKG